MLHYTSKAEFQKSQQMEGAQRQVWAKIEGDHVSRAWFTWVAKQYFWINMVNSGMIFISAIEVL